jgi:DNA repair exonuclease SbcCD nuclease subunit
LYPLNSVKQVLQQQELLQAQSYCREFLSCKKKKKKTVCHQESTTAKEKLKLALQSHGAPNHDLPYIAVFHLHTLLCGVALAATLPP